MAMENQAQYDASVGGTQELPSHINLLQFTSARSREIHDLKLSMRNLKCTKMAFQKLPRHMRRRIMSHNVKRLPRRLHEVHLNQMKKSGMPPPQKKSTRKYRRRPFNLFSDYFRRQRHHNWLETHIWHAKRFHMINKWNYRLADRPCDKAFRACYRASTNHCLVQDISYFSCLEISGPIQVLLNKLNDICDNFGLSIGAKAFINGNREGQKVFYKFTNGLKKAIGTVYFHWKPLIEHCSNETLRTLWLWIHPSFYFEMLDLLKSCFDLQKSESDMSYNNTSFNICMIELRNNLNRFRLTGPWALSILYNTLKISTLENSSSEWFKCYLSDKKNLNIFAEQCEYWKNIKSFSSPSELSPHHVLSLVVRDPRYHLSKTKTKAVISEHNNVNYVDIPKNSALGPIWSSIVRKEVKENKISNEDISKQRINLLIPGTELETPSIAIPIIIIQRPGNHDIHLGYSSGWDLIVPSGWGHTFWMSLIMWGGRAGGLREFDYLEFENGRPNFLQPDTNAGINEEQQTTKAYEHKFFKLPPNKRPNYTKLGVINPFCFNWNTLIQNWNSRLNNDFFVLRDKKILQNIRELILKRDKYINKSGIDFAINCIVPIRINLDKKGIAKHFARIYLPHSDDIQKGGLVEPLHLDENEKLRKNMRSDHKLLLKQLRRKKDKITDDNIEKYSYSMKKLWLPNEIKDKSCAARSIIGFVTMGGFSYSQAHGCAVGYIAMGAINALLQNVQRNKILVRNISSRQYRVATLQVIT